MKSPVKVIVKEDDSLERLLDRTAEKLQNKYEKKRKVRTGLLKKLPLWQAVCLAVLQVVCCISLLFSAIACIASVNSRINCLEPNMLGYSYVSTQGNLKISDKKTLTLDEKIIVHSVDTSTLRPAMGGFMGDVIAYYTYSKTYQGIELEDLIPVTEYSSKIAYKTDWKSLFGYQPDIITQAAKAGSSLVVHHIKGIYRDARGVRFFLTYGNEIDIDDYSGSSIDGGYQGYLVREDMVTGAYDSTFSAGLNTLYLRAMQGAWGVVMLMLPLMIIIAIIIIECLRDIQISKLQQDIIEEKRKITDEICVSNEVGFGMKEADKRKVLAQAEEKDRLTYISLLWRDGSAPAGIKKYLLRRRQMLGPTQELLEVNRKCQQMFKDGVDAKKIAKYYQKEKERIEKEETEIRRKMRELHKRYDDKAYAKRQAELEKLDQEVTEEMVSLQIQASRPQKETPAKKKVQKPSSQQPKAPVKRKTTPTKKDTKTTTKTSKKVVKTSPKTKPTANATKKVVEKTPVKKSVKAPSKKETTPSKAKSVKSSAKSVAKKSTKK